MDRDDERSQGDPAGLGRGPLTRWLPVWLQAPARPPAVAAITVGSATTPARFVLRVIFSAPRYTVPAGLCFIGHQVGWPLVPLVTGAAIDRALAPGDPAQLVLWLLVLAGLFVGLGLGFRFAAQLTALAVQLVQHRLRSALSAMVVHRPERRLKESDGAVLSTTTNDVTVLATGVGMGVYPLGEVVGIVFIAGAMLAIHWPLGLAVAVGAPLVLWSMGALTGPFARSRRAYQGLLAESVGRATDLVTGYRVIKGIGAEDEAVRRYRNASQDVLAGARRNLRALGVYLVGTNMINGVFVAAVAALAAYFAITGEITVGQLIAAAGLAQALIPPLAMLTGNAGTAWGGLLASGGRILDMLRAADGPPAVPAGTSGHSLAPVPTVRLRIPGHDPIRVEPGELVGLRTDDRTAADIVDVLLDPYSAPDGSEVALDGIAARALAPDVYRSRVVVSPHAVTLFNGTLAENIDLAPGSSDRRADAIRAAACEDFIAFTPEGVTRQVGESGNRLSGGQRQRVALARALAGDAAVLILQDPTTAVDSVTEAAIAERLPAARRGRTTIVVATSPGLLATCDRIVQLDPDRDEAEVAAP